MCLGLSQSKCSGIILVIYDDTSSDIHLKRPNEKKRRKKLLKLRETSKCTSFYKRVVVAFVG